MADSQSEKSKGCTNFLDQTFTLKWYTLSHSLYPHSYSFSFLLQLTLVILNHAMLDKSVCLIWPKVTKVKAMLISSYWLCIFSLSFAFCLFLLHFALTFILCPPSLMSAHKRTKEMTMCLSYLIKYWYICLSVKLILINNIFRIRSNSICYCTFVSFYHSHAVYN